VSVVAPRATAADALSTALAVSPPAIATRLLREADAAALVVAADGSRRWLNGEP
jgi:thiamine biosynthesis lipoprotein ApbE